jgi:hypothetical protein
LTRIENVGILFFKEEININTGLLKLIRGENKMIQCVSYDEVSNEIIQMMRRKTIIPVIGSGFTRDCIARSGKVPSGEDYYNYMIAQIVDQNPDEMKVKELNNESFSSISSIYHKMVQAEKQQSYLLNKFTNVKLENVKKNFLKIDWPYIYTLNIDDAIENNSEFKTVLYANRDIRNSIFEQEKCVIKLHGDIKDILKYEDSNCEIFDQKQYVVSIKKNVSLLKKLTHDYEYLNLLYIGCSLSDEIDLLFSTSMANDNNNNRYYCSTQIPTLLQKTKLEAFGITHCIVFESYDDIYEKMTDAFHQSLCITPDELEQFSTYEFKTLGTGFELNCPYLFQGKSILNNSKIAIYPSFFVSRSVTDKIVENINSKGTQIVVGRGCSGKTYVSYDIIRRVRDREVYAFRSKDRINNETLTLLLNKENCLTIFDSKVLSIKQIEEIILTTSERVVKSNSIIIIENKSNRDLSGLLVLMKMNEHLEDDEIPQLEISNRFSKPKTDEINNYLVTSSLGVFSENKSIADNIINASNLLIQKNKFSQISPLTDNVRQVSSLIVLATLGKVYASDAINLDLVEEFEMQCKKAMPLIEKESTWVFEMSAANNSPLKYVVNAEYWLFNQLDILAKSRKGREKIIEAYRYIIGKLIEINGKPDLMKGEKYAPYKDYILFDNIFQIFRSQGTKIIRDIYQSLNDILATDPNYLHQRAKCYIRSAYKSTEEKDKEKWLEMAYRDASISNSSFEKRYESHENEKIMISAAHSLYTAALALCHIAKLRNYRDISINANAVKCLYKAISSPFNSIEFVNNDATYNYNNVVGDLVSTFATDVKYLKDKDAEEKVAELLMMMISNNTEQ